MACNILEAENGEPMCGVGLRTWGDFLDEGNDSLINLGCLVAHL